MGTMVIALDPQGNPFGLWQSGMQHRRPDPQRARRAGLERGDGRRHRGRRSSSTRPSSGSRFDQMDAETAGEGHRLRHLQHRGEPARRSRRLGPEHAEGLGDLLRGELHRRGGGGGRGEGRQGRPCRAMDTPFGRFAIVEDPWGAPFEVMEPGQPDGSASRAVASPRPRRARLRRMLSRRGFLAARRRRGGLADRGRRRRAAVRAPVRPRPGRPRAGGARAERRGRSARVGRADVDGARPRRELAGRLSARPTGGRRPAGRARAARARRERAQRLRATWSSTGYLADVVAGRRAPVRPGRDRRRRPRLLAPPRGRRRPEAMLIDEFVPLLARAGPADVAGGPVRLVDGRLRRAAAGRDRRAERIAAVAADSPALWSDGRRTSAAGAFDGPRTSRRTTSSPRPTGWPASRCGSPAATAIRSTPPSARSPAACPTWPAPTSATGAHTDTFWRRTAPGSAPVPRVGAARGRVSAQPRQLPVDVLRAGTGRRAAGRRPSRRGTRPSPRARR